MLNFLIKEFMSSANCFCPMGKGTYGTILCSQIVMTIPLQVVVSILCSLGTVQYLQWDGHHNLAAMYSVIGTLTHRAKTVCTGPELFNKDFQHLREVLSRYKYPKWALDMIQSKFITSNWEAGNTQHNKGTPQGQAQYRSHCHSIYTRIRRKS